MSRPGQTRAWWLLLDTHVLHYVDRDATQTLCGIRVDRPTDWWPATETHPKPHSCNLCLGIYEAEVIIGLGRNSRIVA
jgi:hypothetical protein